MDVARTKADPVHRREMPYRIALVRVHHELGLGRRPRCEVEEQRIRCASPDVGREAGGEATGFSEVQPAGSGLADGHTSEITSQSIDLGGICRTGENVSYGAPRESITQIVTREKAGGRNEDNT